MTFVLYPLYWSHSSVLQLRYLLFLRAFVSFSFRIWQCTLMQAVSRTPSQLGNFWKLSAATQNVWRSLVVGGWRSARSCYWSDSSSWFLPLNKYTFFQHEPIDVNTFHPLSSAASNVFLPFRWKVELCSRKTSAWSRHPLLPAVTHAGPLMLSGTPASVL